MSIIDSVKSDNESFIENDSGYLMIGSAKTNSFSRGKISEENSFIDHSNHFKQKAKSKNFFSVNTNGKCLFKQPLFPVIIMNILDLDILF
jgi:hypothetical protein